MKAISLVIFVAICITDVYVYGQGGSDCSKAQANAINIPFTSTNQTTCNKGNDYSNLKLPCSFNYPLYSAGEDYLYYFTASQNAIVTVKLTNINPTNVYSNVLITEGCPGSSGSQCKSFQVSYFSNQLQASVEVIAGKSYFIMLDNYKYSSAMSGCFSFDISITQQVLPILPSCTNANFETGSFSGWSVLSGKSVTGVVGDKTPSFSMTGTGALANRHTIVNGGIDPYGNFPRVAPGGSYSVKLGNDINGAEAEQIRQTFIVDPSNPYFTYRYAVVFMDPQHSKEQQPFFKAQMFDKNGKVIPCSEYVVAADDNIPGFKKSGTGYNVFYKPWTTVAIDLKSYVNEPVTLIITSGDCSPGAHFGYSYVDGSCSNFTNLGSKDTICLGKSKKLQAPDGYASYLWQPGGESTREIFVNSTGVYTVNMTSYTGCTYQLKDTLVVIPTPKADFTYSPHICKVPMIFKSVASTSPAMKNVKWIFDGDANPKQSTDTVVSVNYSTPGDHVVTMISYSSAGCSDTVSKKIYINPCSYSVKLDGGLVCASGCFDLTPQVFLGTPPFTYSWNPSIGAGAGPHKVCPSKDTTIYSVTVTDAVGATTTDTATIIKVSDLSVVTGSKNIGCTVTNDGQAYAKASGGSTPYKYLWNNGAVADTIKNLLAGSYWVTVTDALGCSITDTVQIGKISNSIDVTLNYDSVQLCYGGNIDIKATGADTYQWSPAIGLSNTIGDVVSASPVNDIIFTVVGRDQSGCSDTSQVVITVSAPIKTSFQTTPATCQQSDGTILTTTTGGKSPFSYLWTNGNTSKDLIQASSGYYGLTITDATACIRHDTVLLINKNIGFPVSVVPGKINICKGDYTTLTAKGGYFYQWYLNGSDAGIGDSINVRPDQKETYWVIATDTLGCIDSSSVTLAVLPLPSISLQPNTSVCAGQSVKLIASGAIEYLWFPQNQFTAMHEMIVQPSATKTFSILGKDANGCIGDTAFSTITIHPLPVVNTSGDTSVVKATSLNLVTQYSGDVTSWKWEPSLNLNCTDCPSPTVTIYRPVTYKITVANQFGCKAEDIISFRLNCKGAFVYIPNAFTPDGDGKHETFYPIIDADVMVKNFSVFDRWGGLVYQIKNISSKGLTKGWDGRFKGNLMESNAFVYMLRLQCEGNETFFYKGTVLLLR